MTHHQVSEIIKSAKFEINKRKRGGVQWLLSKPVPFETIKIIYLSPSLPVIHHFPRPMTRTGKTSSQINKETRKLGRYIYLPRPYLFQRAANRKVSWPRYRAISMALTISQREEVHEIPLTTTTTTTTSFSISCLSRRHIAPSPSSSSSPPPFSKVIRFVAVA